MIMDRLHGYGGECKMRFARVSLSTFPIDKLKAAAGVFGTMTVKAVTIVGKMAVYGMVVLSQA